MTNFFLSDRKCVTKCNFISHFFFGITNMCFSFRYIGKLWKENSEIIYESQSLGTDTEGDKIKVRVVRLQVF